MHVLFESPAGYSLFHVLDDDKIKQVETIGQLFSTADTARELLQLRRFSKFRDTVEAMTSVTSSNEGKLPDKLRSLLKKEFFKGGLSDSLAVGDPKLANLIKEKFNINCCTDTNVLELIRGIRSQFSNLVPDVSDDDLYKMSLGLAHSLSRYKMKFGGDKMDTMIVQAVSLLDDIDKELNNYMMRCKEWYGWHFPEMSSIVPDGITYARAILKMGYKSNTCDTDLSDVIDSEDTIKSLKAAAEVSIGTEISELDLINIKLLCEQIVEMSDYRTQLSDYLVSRMNIVAPNLSVIVGEVVGARLIAHAGSTLNLAKCPASTLQILGAEKALFRALKAGKTTPKYGLIYHSSVVSQTTAQFKGRASRTLAAKAALAVRIDALSDKQSRLETTLKNKSVIENRMRALESNQNRRLTDTGKFAPKMEQYAKPLNKSYNAKDDFNFTKEKIQPQKRKFENVEQTTNDIEEEEDVGTFKQFKKDKHSEPEFKDESVPNDNDVVNTSAEVSGKKKNSNQ